MKRIRTLTLILITCSTAIVKTGWSKEFFGDPFFLLGPVGQALAGAGYAAKLPHDNLFLNPAAGAFSTEYDADLTYSTANDALSATVFDTKSTSYGAGLHFLRRNASSDDINRSLRSGTFVNRYQDAGLSLFGKIQERIALGITGRLSNRTWTGTANLNGSAFNGDVGVAIKVLNGLTVGGVYKNILGDKKNLELRDLAGGVTYEILPNISVNGSIDKYSATSSNPDVDVPFQSKIVWALSGEFRASDSGFALRGGYRDSGPWKGTLILAGLGFSKDSFHLDYGLALSTKEQKFSVHTFGLGANF